MMRMILPLRSPFSAHTMASPGKRQGSTRSILTCWVFLIGLKFAQERCVLKAHGISRCNLSCTRRILPGDIIPRFCRQPLQPWSRPDSSERLAVCSIKDKSLFAYERSALTYLLDPPARRDPLNWLLDKNQAFSAHGLSLTSRRSFDYKQ
jgi:hypothetical protein